jgi:hypothetical protein
MSQQYDAYKVQNRNLKAMSSNSSQNVAGFSGLGFHQYLNFGKFKPPKGERRTWYDLANMGEFNYLRWLLKQKTARRPKIQIRQDCFPHIEAALQSENGQSPWTKTNIVEGKRAFLMYTAFNTAGHPIQSPRIEVKHCKGCDMTKCEYMFTQDESICDTCLKNIPGASTEEVVQVANILPAPPSPKPESMPLLESVKEETDEDLERFEQMLRERKMRNQMNRKM